MPVSATALSDASLSTQMNVRMERAVKAQGDAVLERFGITPSQAVRGLWQYIALHDDVPEYMKEQRRRSEHERREEMRASAEGGRGLAIRLAIDKGLLSRDDCLVQAGPDDYAAMEDAMYEGMLDDYHTYCR